MYHELCSICISVLNLEANDAVIDRHGQELADVRGDVQRWILKPSELYNASKQRHQPSTYKDL